MRKELLESLLKKCPNITKVIMNTGIEYLSVIGQYCPRLKSLTNFNQEVKDLPFFRMYGHKLEELRYLSSKCVVQEILEFCPNLKKVFIGSNGFYEFICTENKEFLPKLEEIEESIEIHKYKQIEILSDKYSKTIKRLNVELCCMPEEELKTCIECIARFENLKELKLKIDCMDIEEPIDDCLSLIGQKCNKLLKLDLDIEEPVPISKRFFNIFSQFKAIKKLKIELYHNRVLSGSVECFKHCKQLKHLDINYPELREDFFANIASFVPKLQSLKVSTNTEFSDLVIHSFYSLKNIQSIDFVNKKLYRILSAKYYYFGKSLIEVMLSPNGMNVKHITHNCGLITYTRNLR